MFIREIYIEGFGIFQNQKFQFSPALNVVFGPNEAGKSTLLAFIRHVLFGFPDGRSKERQYEALRGGRLGGRLIIEDHHGDSYTIERFAGTRGGDLIVRLPDGSTGTENTLRDILGNTTRDVFCKIFAFGLDELQRFNTLEDEGVRAHIYSAGTGGISISDIEKRLSQKADELFKPRASNPPINKLIKNLDSQSQELRGLAQQSQEYDGLVSQRDVLRQTINMSVKDKNATGNRISQLARYKDAWEPWRQLVDVQKELDNLAVVESFPEDAENRLNRIEEKRETLQEKIEAATQKIQSLNQKVDQLPVDDVILSFETELEVLRSDRNRYDAQFQECVRVQGELQKHEEDLQESLRLLGPDWTEEHVEAFDGSIQAQETIRRFKTKLEKASVDHQDLVRQMKEAKRHFEDVQRTLADLQEQKTEEGAINEEEHKEKKSSFQKLFQLHTRYIAVADIDLAANPSQNMMLPVWPIYVLGALALIGGVGGWAAGSPILGGIGGGVFLLCSLGYWLFQRQMVSKSSDVNPVRTPDQTLKKQAEEIKKIARRFDIDGMPSEADLTRIQNDLEKDGETIQKQKSSETRIKEIERDVVHKKQAMDHLLAENGQAEQSLQQAQDAWESFLKEQGLPTSLLPDSTLLLVTEIKNARERLKNVEAERQRLEILQGHVIHFEKQVREGAKGCGRPGGEGQSILSLVDYLIRELDLNRENKRQLNNLQEDLHEQETELENLGQQLEEQNNALKVLLETVSAEDVDGFWEKHTIYQKRQGLLDKQQQYRQELERLLGVGGNYTQALETLQSTSLVELENDIGSLQQILQETQTKLDIKREELGGLRTRIEDMESQERASELRLAHQTDRERLNMLATEWASWTVANALLTEARRFYEKERRPGVIKEAEALFTQMTDGYYTQVLAPLDGSDILVGDQNGGTRATHNLSRGTAEQLYLSLRMGLIREFGRNAQILPVIMDDITVNFDSERAEHAVRAFYQLSNDHQLIVFTCHAATKDLFVNLDDEDKSNLIELDRQVAFTGWVSQLRDTADLDQAFHAIDVEALSEFVLDALENGGRSIVELETDLKVDKEILRSVLEKLKSRGKVDAAGRGRGTKWVLLS